jgi:hypothetical protein
LSDLCHGPFSRLRGLSRLGFLPDAVCGERVYDLGRGVHSAVLALAKIVDAL